jgi:hypothetical protein
MAASEAGADKAVVGVFTYVDDTIKAVERLKIGQYKFKAYSPTYVPELVESIDDTRSPAAAISLMGSVTGITGGFTLAVLCNLDYPIRVSAKDIIAPPAFVPVGYECTILFTAIFSLKALLWFCGLPNILRKVGYKPEFSNDKFGLVVRCGGSQTEEVSAILSQSGADSVETEQGL